MPQRTTTPPKPEVTPSTTSMGQEERAAPKDVQSGSPSIMMPSIGFPEQSPTTGLIGTRPSLIEISPSPVSSPPSDEDVYYLGDNFDFGDESPPPDIGKFSHLIVKEMEVTSPMEMVLPPAEIASTKSKV